MCLGKDEWYKLLESKKIMLSHILQDLLISWNFSCFISTLSFFDLEFEMSIGLLYNFLLRND